MKIRPLLITAFFVGLVGCQKTPIDSPVEKRGVGPGSGKPSKSTNCNARNSAADFMNSQPDQFGKIQKGSVVSGCFGSQKDCQFPLSETSKDKFAHISFLYYREESSQPIVTTASVFINISDKCQAVGWGVTDLVEKSESVSGCNFRKAISKYEGITESHPRLKFLGSRLSYTVFGIKQRNVLSSNLPESTYEVFSAFQNEDGGSTLGLFFVDSKTCKVIGNQRTNLDLIKLTDLDSEASPTPIPLPTSESQLELPFEEQPQD